MSFSVGRVALAGFRLTGRRPLTVLAWSVASLVFMLVAVAAAIVAAGGLQAISAMAGRAANPGAASLASVGWTIARVYAALLLVSVVWTSVLYCAVYRSVLRPEESAFAYLRLGRDELRMMGLMAFLMLTGLVAVFGVSLLVAMLQSVLAIAVSAIAGPGAAGLASILGLILTLAAFVWLLVRVSFAGPMTFATRKFALAKAWELTEGKFWPLLGTYAISWILVLAMYLAMTALGFFAARGVGGENAGLGQILLSLIPLLINLLLGGVFCAALVAPTAVAYEAYAPRRKELAETFA